MSSLVVLRDYVSMREQAMSFLQREGLNPILRARALRWLGVASQHLGTMDAVGMLYQALEEEKTYAGRDTWAVHYLLAQALDNPTESMKHYKASAELVAARAASLVGREEMRDTFLQSELVQNIYSKAGINPLEVKQSLQD
jgi:hypothetical protein